jgi:hypothetical protein
LSGSAKLAAAQEIIASAVVYRETEAKHLVFQRPQRMTLPSQTLQGFRRGIVETPADEST